MTIKGFFKHRFRLEPGSFKGPHKIRFKLSNVCYVYPQWCGVRGSWYDHPFPDGSHIDWSKEPKRIQPYTEVWFWWLWFRFYMTLHMGKTYQANEDVAMRNAKRGNPRVSITTISDN